MNKPDIAKLVAAAFEAEFGSYRNAELQHITAVNDGQHGESLPLCLHLTKKGESHKTFEAQRLNWWRGLFDERMTLDDAAGLLLGFSQGITGTATIIANPDEANQLLKKHQKGNNNIDAKQLQAFVRRQGVISTDLVKEFSARRGDIEDWRVPSDGKYRAGDLIAWAKEKDFVADEVLNAWEAYQAETKKTQTKTASNDGLDFKMLARRDQLINAFGAFTGMDATWFENLTDTPKLMSARKVKGKGGRGHIAEPLFCPYEVMVWLIDPKRRKGNPIQPETAWRMLETHFQTVYNARSIGDPREGVD